MNKHALESTACLLSLLLPLAGCTEHVDGGVEPDASEATAVAILGSNLPANAGELLSNAQISVKPDSLYVFIGNTNQTCASPVVPFTCGSDTEWQFVLGIPAALQVPGPLPLSTALPSTGVDNVVALDGSSGGDPSACAGTAAPNGLTGDIRITSIDPTQVTLQLSGVTPNVWIGSTLPTFNAEYVAPRCP